jgi:hypothetical protein
MEKDTKLYISYNQVHQLIKDSVERYRINEDFRPDLMIAIGGGGFIPARILVIKKKDYQKIFYFSLRVLEFTFGFTQIMFYYQFLTLSFLFLLLDKKSVHS